MTVNTEDRIFYVDGWGKTGYANLAAFAPFQGFKLVGDLEVNEVTEGKFCIAGAQSKPERVTRVY